VQVLSDFDSIDMPLIAQQFSQRDSTRHILLKKNGMLLLLETRQVNKEKIPVKESMCMMSCGAHFFIG
jgi:hypothetical protein